MNRPSPTSLRKRVVITAATAAALAASLASRRRRLRRPPTNPSIPRRSLHRLRTTWTAVHEAGQAIRCDLAFLDPNQPVEQPTGIIYGSGATAFELLDTSTRTVVGKRYYDANGLLLRRHFHDD